MITIQSTADCVNTPAVLFALAEAGVAYRAEQVPDGWFTERFGIPGPAYVEADGDATWTLVELGAILRHVARAHAPGRLWPAALRGQAEVDRWAEFFSKRISRAVEAARGGDPSAAIGLFARLEHQLAAGGGDWLLGDFTIVDCFGVIATRARPLLPPGKLPRFAAYLDRVAARAAR